jgi:phage terminase large subunit
MDNAVFDDFSSEEHVKPTAYDACLPLYLAMDFGYLNPFVCLWIQIDRNGVTRVIDEYIQNKTVISKHGETVILRTPGGLESISHAYCDPAGTHRNTVTGTSDIEELRDRGIRCTYRPSEILDGVELIRRALKNGQGKSHFAVDPKCRQLIEAMRCYHYPQDAARRANEQPVKDGVYDHPIDALRYFFVNRDPRGKTKTWRY